MTIRVVRGRKRKKKELPSPDALFCEETGKCASITRDVTYRALSRARNKIVALFIVTIANRTKGGQ